MACDECSKCWFNYIEECEGQEDYKEDVCKKKNIIDADADADTDTEIDKDSSEKIKNKI
jgi:hypothetical protein